MVLTGRMRSSSEAIAEPLVRANDLIDAYEGTTHDLLRSAIGSLGAEIVAVEITDLRDDTFYAMIWLEKNGEMISVDSRPSDALAIALRTDCPIYVEEQVIRTSKATSSVSDKVTNDELKKWLESLNDEDLGRYKM